ncbi:hypothetical protein D3C86_1210930 [compost metagenome]
MRRTFFIAAYLLISSRSKSGYGFTKLKAVPSAVQSPSQPWFQPSTKTPSRPLSAAKSRYSLVFFVVAPCFSPCPHVYFSKCMPHQIPMYFEGAIHEMSLILEGSFKLSINVEVTKSPGVFPTITVLQGVSKGACAYTFTPSAQGTSSLLY